jgi:lysyl-tRNA synthetase class 1
MSEHHYWADRMADEIIERSERDPLLKTLVEKNGYFVYDEKTPSGEIHIGSGRGWVIHDVLAKALRQRGKRARFVLSSDDYDPLDKPVKGMPEFDKYLGVPFKNIPSPIPGFKSWADYYFTQSTSKFAEWGIEADLESTGEEYRKGTFNEAIRAVLNNTGKVQAIFERIYGKPYERIPFNPICEKCGKIGTTVTTHWDPHKEIVTYTCAEDLVKWARGCGHIGHVSPFNGAGKLPWKVEWAAKWPSKGVIVETAGKDHFTKGGSRTVAIAISSEVLCYPPPYPSTATEEGPGYEFFNIGGKKMSTSRGVGASFASITEHIPAKILRFLVVSYKPHAVIDFDPSRKDDLLLLYDRYDTAERVYFGEEESDRAQELKRIYEFAQIGKLLQKMPPQITLRHAGIVVQIVGESDDDAIALLQRRGEIPQALSTAEVAYLNDRLAAARKWILEFAPAREKFRVQEIVPAQVKERLSEQQKAGAHDLAAFLRKRPCTEQELFEEFYAICERRGIPNTEFFKGIYLILLGQEWGPKLANLILTLGEERVAALLAQA